MKNPDEELTEKKLHVLIADDDEGIRVLLEVLCSNLGYTTSTVSDGNEAVKAIEADRPDLVLLDCIMPGKNGFDVLSEVKKKSSLAHIPIILLTGLSSREDRITGIAAGATDFITKPIDEEELSLRLKNVFKLKEYQNLLEHEAYLLDKLVEERTTELWTALNQTKDAYSETIYRLAILSEYRDSDTGAHIQRIGEFARHLASITGQSISFQEDIYYSSILHDIGKISTPDSILLKKGSLNKEEWAAMMRHTEIGAKILSNSKSPYLKMGEKIANYHHERWDGSGYPEGLRGSEIPLEARITNLVDQYDALRSDRPYKKGFSHEKTKEIITKGDGRTQPEHFDPELLDCFIKNHQDFESIYQDLQDDSILRRIL